jgi:subtilisin family serine protease
MRFAVGKASIVNVSLSSANAYDPRATQQAVRAGLLIVVAAGNDALANPVWPARFAKEAWANNQVIAVGAVDANHRIASFSNRAGDTAAWFLVAPGVDIVSSYVNGQYVYMSGTSMATPVVSGAAALVK